MNEMVNKLATDILKTITSEALDVASYNREWLKNDMYFLFEIPMYGGQPRHVDNYIPSHIDILIEKIESWT